MVLPNCHRRVSDISSFWSCSSPRYLSTCHFAPACGCLLCNPFSFLTAIRVSIPSCALRFAPSPPPASDIASPWPRPHRNPSTSPPARFATGLAQTPGDAAFQHSTTLANFHSIPCSMRNSWSRRMSAGRCPSQSLPPSSWPAAYLLFLLPSPVHRAIRLRP